MVDNQSRRDNKKTLSDPVDRGMLNDAVDIILEGMDNLFSRFKKETDDLKSEVKKNGLAISRLKNDFEGLLEEFSDTPSRKEVNDLKTKVDRFHSTN